MTVSVTGFQFNRKIACMLAFFILVSCSDIDVSKSLAKGVDIVAGLQVALKDAEAKAFITSEESAPYTAFLDRTKTNLTQAQAIAGNVSALDPDAKKNILAILTTIRAGLSDMDISGIKDAGVKKRIQGGFLAFGTGIDALRITLQ